MKKLALCFCLFFILFSCLGCKKGISQISAEQLESSDVYTIESNGDLHITINEQRTILEINALTDSQIIEDDHMRLLILSDPSDKYQHGILGDAIEASSVSIVQLSDKPKVISKFSVPNDLVIESILPIWKDWDGDGEREILLTLSNSSSGAKLVLYDEDGNSLAESEAIGKGYRWRHALDIASFGEDGQMLLADVQTPHIGGIVNFYSWDKENKLLKTESSLSGYSTHDIASRNMQMYTLLWDNHNEQTLLILPNQSKTELTALRFASGAIHKEWTIELGGKLSGKLEIEDNNGVQMIRAIVDKNREVLISIPE